MSWLYSAVTGSLLLACSASTAAEGPNPKSPVPTHVFDAMWHDFQSMPEARALDAEVFAFLEKHLGD